MDKIIVHIRGGVGNQLFCYAAARRLALINNAELVIDDISDFTHDYRYQRTYQLHHFDIKGRKATPQERMQPLSRLRRYYKNILNGYFAFENRNYIKQEGRNFDSRLIHFKPRGTVHLDGYWQSENYFKDIAATIRTDLRMKTPIDQTNLQLATQIKNNHAVAIHVRFFDAPSQAEINNAPREYYIRAIKQMEKWVPNAHYYLFSDRSENASERLLIDKSRMTLVAYNQGDERAYADLWLMSLCKHFIIANSTFSWWGAWLASQKNKYVIAPKLQLARWGFEGLLPDDWIEL